MALSSYAYFSAGEDLIGQLGGHTSASGPLAHADTAPTKLCAHILNIANVYDLVHL